MPQAEGEASAAEEVPQAEGEASAAELGDWAGAEWMGHSFVGRGACSR